MWRMSNLQATIFIAVVVVAWARITHRWAERMGLTAQQYSNYENGYPLPRDPAIVLATVWIGTASSEMQLRRREGSGPSQ